MLTDESGEILTSEGANGVFTYDAYGNAQGNVAAAGYPYRFTGRRLDPIQRIIPHIGVQIHLVIIANRVGL